MEHPYESRKRKPFLTCRSIRSLHGLHLQKADISSRLYLWCKQKDCHLPVELHILKADDYLSNVYRIHSPTALKLSHRTDSSGSCISSITRTLSPSFSNVDRCSGTSFTRLPMSLHAIASIFLSESQFLLVISASLLGSSLSSRILLAFSRQKVGFRWGGDHLR